MFGEHKAMELALAGGDDYELCFTLPTGHRETVQAIAQKHAVKITRIGRIAVGNGVRLTGDAAVSELPSVWQHFREASS